MAIAAPSTSSGWQPGVRSYDAVLTENLFDQSMHAAKGGLGAFRSFCLFRRRQRQIVVGGHEAAPMQAPAVRMASEMAGTEIIRQADLCCFLAQEGGSEVGALGDIDPAKRS